ncbi:MULTISPECIES: PTS trehalose transporter subunit IIBC [unclassified Gilliamella]|uniref:PTS trehalose transporter subunit IIBC n=1 Tax=unclassified Gilliamella TaxID=2685620 RepID=UPI0022698D22|nr:MULTISPECIES: PTS trehalose transporter subunit IIBC [unclassified Gilliamella]MCX8657241.1 PTS trehalose transporter subunit IIBC [Gilliamella sp. B2894]MCX8665836.1 PTS trehalose transporter subunit IIBC [Gilliamella sp. B2887]MCX8693686.1 PTS trehalose transporter subunit IIBC [Gilliamella sp. B2881]MCX8697114.1 PTS trehalose transporter subunit IIBC [Gilliamella sp. B2828]MCX8699101.1 PTS trehalose transporter subunit IIBC [Gilliamella sp. B3000]
MAKDSKISTESITQLVDLIGGKENIASVTHCLTRLRFALIDPNIANVDAIQALPFVKGCFNNAGQFQVIIGTNVDSYYKTLTQQLNLDEASKEQTKAAAKKNMSFFEQLIANLAEIFVPLLPALIAGGLLLGLRNIIGEMPTIDDKPLIQTYHWLEPIYNILWLPCEAIFHFLPVAICWSTVKKMGGSPVLGLILGITLVSPQLMNAYDLGSKIPEVWDFGWSSIEKVGYQAQVIPSIFAGLALGWIETRLRKIVPDYLTLVIVPIVALLASVFLAHFLLGPFGRMLGNGIATVVKYLMTGDYAFIGSAIFGFFYSPLVITGIHHTTLAIDMQMTESMGGTPLWPIIALSNIAQASAVVGIILVSKKHNEREVSVPAAISAYLGVTEPAMYGINLRYKFPMLCAMIGAALAGLICGLFGVLSNGIGVGGLPGILSIKPVYWSIYALAMIVAIVVPIVLTATVYKIKLKQGTLDIR